jgi:Na(+)-translocating NADH:ubiquinone oxidoreductase B subunit
MVAAGIVFGVVVGKELFGGTGRNLFNPALVGRCFLSLSYPAAMAPAWLKPGTGLAGRVFQYVDVSDVQAITSATPLVLAKQGQFVELSDLFLGRIAGSAGETSALAIILGGMLLLISRVANWRTVLSTLGSFILLAAVLHYIRPDIFGPVIWNLFAGGLLFGAFYMATDPVTSPTTNGGKWAYGIIIGTATVLIRNLTGYVEGVTFAILLGNICAPVLDEVVVRHRLRRLQDEG